MDVKPFDIILYGASGYTGRCVAKYIQYLNTDIRWAIAGRTHSKLAGLKNELMEMKTLRENPKKASPSYPDILIAEVGDFRSLVDLFGTCKIVLNCTGPYRFLGQEIVEACITAGAHYMDICGEPQFMEQSFLKFHDLATKKGSVIIHACAFDSVPADLGCMFAAQQFPPKMCSSIESFLVLNCPHGLAAHYTTFECAVHGLGDAAALRKLRSEINETFKCPKPVQIGPKLKRKQSYYFEKRLQNYVTPFMGADPSVVRSSYRALSMSEGHSFWPQYAAYVAVGNVYNVATTAFYGSVCSSLASFSIGRSLLLSFPSLVTAGVFSHSGPSEKQLANTSFELHFYAKGYVNRDPSTNGRLVGDHKGYDRSGASIQPSEVGQTVIVKNSCINLFERKKIVSAPSAPPAPEREVHVVVSGPEPGYVATPVILVTLAFCFLEESKSMPRGGVFTPAAAFYRSPTVIDRLDQAGIQFTLVDSIQHDRDDGEVMVEDVIVATSAENFGEFETQIGSSIAKYSEE